MKTVKVADPPIFDRKIQDDLFCMFINDVSAKTSRVYIRDSPRDIAFPKVKFFFADYFSFQEGFEGSKFCIGKVGLRLQCGLQTARYVFCSFYCLSILIDELNVSNAVRFRNKRAWYFLNAASSQLSEMADDDESKCACTCTRPIHNTVVDDWNTLDERRCLRACSTSLS